MVGWRINFLWGFRRKQLEVQVLVNDKLGLLLSCRVNRAFGVCWLPAIVTANCTLTVDTVTSADISLWVK